MYFNLNLLFYEFLVTFVVAIIFGIGVVLTIFGLVFLNKYVLLDLDQIL